MVLDPRAAPPANTASFPPRISQAAERGDQPEILLNSSPYLSFGLSLSEIPAAPGWTALKFSKPRKFSPTPAHSDCRR